MVEAAVRKLEIETLPRIITPMSPRPAKELPTNLKDWYTELKWDGVRALVYLDKERQQIRVETKTGRNVTENFPEFSSGLSHLIQKHSLVFDGEIVFKEGQMGMEKTASSRSQSKPPIISPDLNQTRCRYFIFDLLYLDQKNLMDQALSDRRRKLAKLISIRNQNKFGVHITPYWQAKEWTETLMENAKAQGYEGVVLKRMNSLYHQGGSRDWLKLKFS